MPRIRQYAQKYADADFMKEIQHQKVECGIKTDAKLAELINISKSNFCNRKKRPENFTVAELRGLVATLSPDPVILLKFLGYQGRDIPEEIKEAAG